MKKYVWLLYLCCFPVITSAQEIDLLSDDIILTSDSKKQDATGSIPDDVNAITSDDQYEDSQGAVFGFIQPIIDFFTSEDEETDVVSGEPKPKKETYLEKSIRLADEGNLDTQMNLGYMYLYGTNGVEQDFKEAFKYYSMAAKQDNPIALNNLGSLYFSGIGTPRDVRTALTLFERASDLGNDNASVNLAFIYLTGGKKDKVRSQKAVELFKKAKDENNEIARFMLGYAYYKGFVVPQDMTQAYKLIKTSANGTAKIDEAQMVLAEMYLNGSGTVQNYQSAIAAYRAAVQQGNLEACNILAEIYTKGKITTVNPELAHTIYNIAAAKGDTEAAKKRDALGSTMELESLTLAQANAREFKASPSETTVFIRQTYGTNIRNYIDMNL